MPRFLGLTAMLCAPALLAEALRNGFQRAPEEDALSALLYLVFAVGWFCAVLALRLLRAAGTGPLGRALVTLPLLTLPVAMMQSVFDLVGVRTDSALYMASDLAWPLSMLLTLLVGMAVLFARRLTGWRRFVPLLCGLALPVAILMGVPFGDAGMQLSFPLHTALGWALLGYAVYSAAPRATSRPVFTH